MLEERIIGFYKEEYDVEQGIEPEFDEVFILEEIISKLKTYNYDSSDSKQKILKIAKQLNEEIRVADKKIINFQLAFTNNFISLDVFKRFSRERAKTGWIRNIRRLGISEYNVGSFLVRTEKPFAINFLNRSKQNLEVYLTEEEFPERDINIIEALEDKIIIKDIFALSMLARSYLESAYALYRDFNTGKTSHNLEDIKKNLEDAIYIMHPAINTLNLKKELYPGQNGGIRNFQKITVIRFYHFMGYIKNYIKTIDKDYFYTMDDEVRDLYNEFGIAYPYPHKKNLEKETDLVA